MESPVTAAAVRDSIRQSGRWRSTHAWRPLALVMTAFAVLRTHADPDLWGHVQFGVDLLRDRRLSPVDPYSFTQDRPWINHEWLSELQMGAAYAIGGAAGLMALKGALVVAVCMMLAGSLKHAAPSWRWSAMSLGVFGLLPIALSLRPHLWSLLLIVVLCRTLLNGGRALYGVPALFAGWANLHGGWVVGIGILGAWTCGTLLSFRTHRDARRLTLVTLAAILATLITPYGPELWVFIGETVRLGRENITEWQPIWRDSGEALIAWGLCATFVACVWRQSGRPPLPALLIVTMLGVASLQVNRMVPLFVPAAVILLSGRLPRALPRDSPDRSRILVDGAAVAAAVIVASSVGALPTCITVSGRHAPDLIALASLDGAQPAGRVVTFFDWGEAALFHLAPHVTISMDGRRETVYSDATLREQFAIAHGRSEGLSALDRIRPEYVWLPRPLGNATADWLLANGYRMDVDTERSFVAVRADLPTLRQAALAEAENCFPAGYSHNDTLTRTQRLAHEPP